ncbi:FadR/GntR family transcriptional regulator [Methylobrevis albus]|uniref:FadR family transcriptional regulator n=1 Tax=Methylobrevis albus TaxID=2793297 RepID=A0A931I3N7_9HYPH|nr:FCD domain-containing protein [Methylobrevis albus]MBH0238311.1 FadR family transcriptional regulator [Methylobrevis albus]
MQKADDSGSEAASGSAVDQVVAAIRALIRERGLGVGDVLPSEAELGAMVGAGRNTVREAIRILKAYGIVESRQKVGAVITDRRREAVMDVFSFAIDISAATFRDVQGFRRLVEVNLAETLIGRLPAATLAAMAAENAAMAAAEDPAAAARHDYAFHRLLVEAAGNRTLAEVYAILRPVVQRLMETGKTERRARDGAFREHAAILDALGTGDRLGYAYHMNRHLDAGLEFLPEAGRG